MFTIVAYHMDQGMGPQSDADLMQSKWKLFVGSEHKMKPKNQLFWEWNIYFGILGEYILSLKGI